MIHFDPDCCTWDEEGNPDVCLGPPKEEPNCPACGDSGDRCRYCRLTRLQALRFRIVWRVTGLWQFNRFRRRSGFDSEAPF
ncbi:hypothetical protein [Micromonospora sp. NPDC005652]|uniref:hypothetical protein n=1 Tax=Micromonospora sp. NPDC005652 TaxID=3157046 RepID=UPI00341149E2